MQRNEINFSFVRKCATRCMHAIYMILVLKSATRVEGITIYLSNVLSMCYSSRRECNSYFPGLYIYLLYLSSSKLCYFNERGRNLYFSCSKVCYPNERELNLWRVKGVCLPCFVTTDVLVFSFVSVFTNF